MICRPVSRWPVIVIKSTAGLSTSARPTSPAPVTTLNDAVREADLLVDEPGKLERRERRLLAGLGDHRVAGQDRRRQLADQDADRVVPRDDRGDDAVRDAHQVDRLVPVVARHDVALDPAVPLGRVAGIADRPVDLAPGLADRLAYLANERLGERLAVALQHISDCADVGGALDGGKRGPPLLGRPGGCDRGGDLVGSGSCDGRDPRLRRRVEHVDGRSGARRPVAADQQAVSMRGRQWSLCLP